MEENKIIIDLSQETLTESWLKMFGSSIQMILNAMFGSEYIPVTVRGSPLEVKSFANTLSKEKKYMDAYKQYGLDNPNTYRSKFKLDKAIKDFERKTGIKWPLG